VKLGPFGFVLAVAAVTGAAPSACSSTIALPPSVGDCIPRGDASCTEPRGGGGSLAGGSQDGGSEADGAEVIPSGSSCGAAGQAIMSSTANLSCYPCIVGDPEGGLGHCCLADNNCSADLGCLAIVTCVLSKCTSGSPACVLEMCEPSSTQGSVTLYNDLGSCLAQNCSPACPPLPQGNALPGPDL